MCFHIYLHTSTKRQLPQAKAHNVTPLHTWSAPTCWTQTLRRSEFNFGPPVETWKHPRMFCWKKCLSMYIQMYVYVSYPVWVNGIIFHPPTKKKIYKIISRFGDDFKSCTTVILLQLIDEGFITVNPIIISCAHQNKGTSASLKKNSDQGTLTPLATARKPSSMAFKRLESDGFSRVFFFWLESDQSKWLILFPHLEDSHVLGEIQVIKRLLLGVVWRFWIFKEKPWKYAAGPWKWENWSNFLPFGSILFEALKKFNWIYWKPPTGPNSQHPHLLDTACRQSIDCTFRHMPNEDIKNSTSGQPNSFRCHLKAEGFCFSPPNTSIHPLQSQWFFRRFPIPKVSQKVSPCPKDDSREIRLNTSGWIASAKLTVIFSSQVGSEFTALMANTGASGTAHWMSGLVIHPEDFTPKWFKKNWPRQSWAMVGKKTP